MTLTLRQARLVKELTQEQMADILGVHVQTYRKIELNPDSATIKEAKILASKLGLDYNDIFFGNNSILTREKQANNNPKTT